MSGSLQGFYRQHCVVCELLHELDSHRLDHGSGPAKWGLLRFPLFIAAERQRQLCELFT